MRKPFDPQYKIGEIDIANIEIDLQSRDEIPQVLLGLQDIYTNKPLLSEIFSALTEIIPQNISINSGRPGMHFWNILVLAIIRHCCNFDYDKLTELANEHRTLRLYLGHSIFDPKRYGLQTIKDNVRLIPVEIVERISRLIVMHGHATTTEDGPLRGRCDSFVVETNVHFPTDINLLWDAIRKIIELIERECARQGRTEWRQSKYILKKIKKLYRKAQRLKRSKSRNEKVRAKKAKDIVDAHVQYIQFVASYTLRAKATLSMLKTANVESVALIMLIEKFIVDAERQIDQIHRRVVLGEKIPHEEKVFSIFEPHTEWISKGKAGVPQELGLKVCILTEQHGFILHHRVMQKQTDDAVAVPMTDEAKQKFPKLESCSYDKGFHSQSNQMKLAEILDLVVLPRKGKLSKEAVEYQSSEEFVKERRRHSAVESDISALENHCLDRCPDHGIVGFERYVALAVMARNIHILGARIRKRELRKLQKAKDKQKIAA